MKNLFIIILATTTALLSYAQSPWTQKASLSNVRLGHASVALDGKIYVIGGSYSTSDNRGSALSLLEMYDPLTDSWITKAEMDTGVAYVSCFVVNEKIWAIGGGESYYRNPTRSIREYDPDSDSWTTIATMPKARTHQSGILLDGKLYIFGGGGENIDPIAEVDVYDTLTKTWTQVADLPTPRMNMAAVALDGIIYAIGGMLGLDDDEETMPTVEMYDPSTDTWTTKAEMNIPRKYLSGCAFNRSGKIYVFGGTPGFLAPSLSSIEAYDPETDTWTVVSEMPLRLCAHSVAWDGEKAYISGGSEYVQPVIINYNTFFQYDPSKDLMPLIKEINVDKSYAKPGTDSILITSALRDTAGLSVNAVLVSPEGNIVDSLPLFDDGNHGDENPEDSVYANTWFVDPAYEQHYYAGLHLTLEDTDTVVHHIDTLARFTTIGPLTVSRITYTPADTIPNPGDHLRMYPWLQNEGVLSSAENITGRIRSLDTLAEIVSDFNLYPNIPPEENVKSSISNIIDISSSCEDGYELFFELEIMSNEFTYWKDTFSIIVIKEDALHSVEQSNIRIFPNPATDRLTINFATILNPRIRISVLDITGKEIYTEIHITGSSTCTLNLSSLREGLYFIRISNDAYSFIEKVIKIE